MHLTTKCPICHKQIVLILPSQNIHHLPEGKIVGITTAFSMCDFCKANGEKTHRFEAIITIAMTPVEETIDDLG